MVKERERSITKSTKVRFWHCISIEAIRDGEERTLQMILDSSLIGRSYKILTIHRQFAIHFGTKNAISTYLTIDGGSKQLCEPFHFGRKERRGEIRKDLWELTNGSALLLEGTSSDFGLWAWTFCHGRRTKHMELYSRTVSFPYNGKAPVKDYFANLSTDAVPKSISLDREQLVLVHLLTDENIEEISFHLLEEGK
ncbi:hypothetical protein niasHT_008667 [Heterodera trifolii]|uniref:Uncharacterized protein n=1 Tax=Heterodera trifolii TaxID=157864 RepID=A0ABD2M6Q2_9BILA